MKERERKASLQQKSKKIIFDRKKTQNGLFFFGISEAVASKQ